MALTAREWILLPKKEQEKRGPELSPEECRKLRMELSECYFTEEEKEQLTEEQKYRFTHPKKLSEKEREKRAKDELDVLKEWGRIPNGVTYEEWRRRGRPFSWKNAEDM